MNLSTWKSLTPEDQTAWDAVTDDGNTKILNYASIRGNRKDNDSKYRTADSHNLQDNGSNLEVGTHIIEDSPDILAMATRMHKTNRVQSEAHIREPLAKTHHQHTKNVSFERSPFTPEAHAHERISNQELILPYLVMKMNVNMNDVSHLISKQVSTPLRHNNLFRLTQVLRPPTIKMFPQMLISRICLLAFNKESLSNEMNRMDLLVHLLVFELLKPQVNLPVHLMVSDFWHLMIH